MMRMRLFVPILLIVSMLCGCGQGTTSSKPNNLSDGETTELSTRERADAVLDALGSDTRLDAFRAAVDILSLLPENKSAILKRADELQAIYKANGLSASSFTEKFIFNEKDLSALEDSELVECRNHEIATLVNGLVYPVIFEQYGEDVRHIDGLTYTDVVAAAKSKGFTECEELKDLGTSFSYDSEAYSNPQNTNAGKVTVRYYPNGLVYSVEFPIQYHHEPLGNTEFSQFYDLPLNEQKQIASVRFESMAQTTTAFATGSNILSTLYTEQEQLVLRSYINLLTPDTIWESNLLNEVDSGEVSAYAIATLPLHYCGTSAILNFSLNRITLRIMGEDEINEVTSRYYTVLCGYCSDIYAEEDYQDYIDLNRTENDTVYEWEINLDAWTPPDNAPTPAPIDADKTLIADSTIHIEPAYIDSYGNSMGFYTLELPTSWDGQYEIESYELPGYGYGVAFYRQEDRDAGYGGFLFSLDMYQAEEDYNYLPSYSYICTFGVYRLASFELVATYPTDVQFSEASVAQYQAMENDIRSIIESIQFTDEVVTVESSPEFNLSVATATNEWELPSA